MPANIAGISGPPSEVGGLAHHLLMGALLPIKPADVKPSHRLTNLEKQQFSLSAELKEILVGLLLGDLYAQQKISVNARLLFEQGIVNNDYIYYLYELFKSYCSLAPRTTSRLPDKRTGKIYSSTKFQTYALPCFNDLYNLFYPQGKKVIPLNIAELLTPLGLCYWICSDGWFNKTDRAVILCTESFTIEEVNLLVSVLTDKFSLKCNVNKRTNGFRIRISSKSLPELQRLLGPLMPPMMLYKIGL